MGKELLTVGWKLLIKTAIKKKWQSEKQTIPIRVACDWFLFLLGLLEVSILVVW